MSARPIRLVVAALTVLAVSACGTQEKTTTDTQPTPKSSESQTPSAQPSQSPTPQQGTVVKVTVKGDTITPNAAKIKVKRGEEVTLRIDSDREGELHVHSTPEQMVEFGVGKSEAPLKFDRPGLVDVEEHESHHLVVQFEVH